MKRLTVLLFLLQIPCFATNQVISSSPNKHTHSHATHAHADSDNIKTKLICLDNDCLKKPNKKPKNLKEKMLVFGFIRKSQSEIRINIPFVITNLCYVFCQRCDPCHHIEKDFFSILKNYNSSRDFDKLKKCIRIYKIENVKSELNKTPLHLACEKGHQDMVELLIQNGSNINTIDEDGNNALSLACSNGKCETVIWLLDNFNINLETNTKCSQMTPFLDAAEEDHLDILKVLRKKGANVKATNKYGYNALHKVCQWYGSAETVRWLLDHCHIDLEAKAGYKKRTAFLLAAYSDNLEVLKVLKKKGAAINAKDKNGKNALYYANIYSPPNKEVISYLQSLM